MAASIPLPPLATGKLFFFFFVFFLPAVLEPRFVAGKIFVDKENATSSVASTLGNDFKYEAFCEAGGKKAEFSCEDGKGQRTVRRTDPSQRPYLSEHTADLASKTCAQAKNAFLEKEIACRSDGLVKKSSTVLGLNNSEGALPLLPLLVEAFCVAGKVQWQLSCNDAEHQWKIMRLDEGTTNTVPLVNSQTCYHAKDMFFDWGCKTVMRRAELDKEPVVYKAFCEAGGKKAEFSCEDGKQRTVRRTDPSQRPYLSEHTADLAKKTCAQAKNTFLEKELACRSDGLVKKSSTVLGLSNSEGALPLLPLLVEASCVAGDVRWDLSCDDANTEWNIARLDEGTTLKAIFSAKKTCNDHKDVFLDRDCKEVASRASLDKEGPSASVTSTSGDVYQAVCEVAGESWDFTCKDGKRTIARTDMTSFKILGSTEEVLEQGKTCADESHIFMTERCPMLYSLKNTDPSTVPEMSCEAGDEKLEFACPAGEWRIDRRSTRTLKSLGSSTQVIVLEAVGGQDEKTCTEAAEGFWKQCDVQLTLKHNMGLTTLVGGIALQQLVDEGGSAPELLRDEGSKKLVGVVSASGGVAMQEMGEDSGRAVKKLSSDEGSKNIAGVVSESGSVELQEMGEDSVSAPEMVSDEANAEALAAPHVQLGRGSFKARK